MRAALLTGLLLLALASTAQAAGGRPCHDLRVRVAETAFDYAFERTSRDELAAAPDLHVLIDVAHCRRVTGRRARWRFDLQVYDGQENRLVREQGTLEVTPRRSWVQVTG